MINDGSTDQSGEIAAEFDENDERFWLFTQNNAGVSKARNFGLELANGDYILMVDSDDWIEPNMVENLVKNLEESSAGISCCQYDRGEVHGISDIELWDKDKAMELFLIHKRINGSLVNKLMKSEVVGEIRFDDSIKYGEDALFLWQVLRNINSLVITNKVMYHVTLHDDSASGAGGYKPIRRDCISVWTKIAEDAGIVGEKLEKLAKTQLANMAFFSLYEMAYYGYEDCVDENLFTDTLRNNLLFLMDADSVGRNEKVMSYLFLYCKKVARALVKIKKKLFAML